MPRQVSAKAFYRDDGAWLIRLETAICKDKDLPEGWRREFAQAAHQLAARCLEADDIKNRLQDAAKQSKTSKKT